nr:uncharacterized protein LOC127307922 isoform X2 [Lolium perenne]
MYVDGWVKYYDLEHDIAIVEILTPGIPSKARLRHKVVHKSGGKIISVGRVYESRKLVATSGTVIEKIDHKEVLFATCKISKAGIGGSLIDVHGNFLGMNMCCANLTVFLPRNAILQCLERFGIFLGGNKLKGSKLVRSKNKKINDSAPFDFYPPGITLPLQIEVHLPNKQRAMGKLQHYSLDYNIAVVNVQNSLDLKAAYINHQIQFESHCNVIAVGRLFKSGKFIATCGRLTDEPSKLDCKELSTSNCKISKVGIGGPLVDSDGYFVGMNFYDEEVTPFLPRDIIIECLRNFETGTISAENTDRTPNRWPVPKPYWTYPTDPADDLSTMMRSIVSPKSENLSGCSV